MNSDRIVGIGTLSLATLLYWLAGNSEAYLFPRSISVAIGVLGLAILASTLRGSFQSPPVADRSMSAGLRIMPVLAVFVAYRWAMEAIGFYSAAFFAFLTIAWIYAPEPFSIPAVAKRVAVSAAFVGALFALFSWLLRVRTPGGLLF